MQRFINLFGTPLLSGILIGLSYPIWLNVPTGILAWIALVPMLLAMRNASTFETFFLRIYPVVFVGIYVQGIFVFSFSPAAGALTCFSQTIFTFLPLVIHYFIQKKLGWQRAILFLPAVWTVGDWLHHLTPHSFQVSSIAYTQTTVLWFAQYADVFGMWGITFWVILVNVSIALAIEKTIIKRSARFQTSPTLNPPTLISTHLPPLSIFSVFLRKWAFQGILLFGLPILYAFWSNVNLPDGRFIKVALVQTNEKSDLKQDPIQISKNLNNLIRLADSAALTKPDLVVLPESALPFPLMGDTAVFAVVRQYILNWGTSVAVGFPEIPDTTKRQLYYNAAFVFTPALPTRMTAWV